MQSDLGLTLADLRAGLYSFDWRYDRLEEEGAVGLSFEEARQVALEVCAKDLGPDEWRDHGDEPPWAVVSESLAAASSVAELCQTRPCLVYWIGDDAPAGYPTHTQTFPPTAEGSEQLMRAISSSHEAGVGPLKLAGERGVCVGSGRDIIDSGPLGVLVSAYPRPVETGWSGAGGLNSALRNRGLKWRISRSAGHLVLKEVIEP